MPSWLTSGCLSFSFWYGVLIYLLILFVGVDFSFTYWWYLVADSTCCHCEGAGAVYSEPTAISGICTCPLKSMLTGPVCDCLLTAAALLTYVQALWQGSLVLADWLSWCTGGQRGTFFRVHSPRGVLALPSLSALLGCWLDEDTLQ